MVNGLSSIEHEKNDTSRPVAACVHGKQAISTREEVLMKNVVRSFLVLVCAALIGGLVVPAVAAEDVPDVSSILGQKDASTVVTRAQLRALEQSIDPNFVEEEGNSFTDGYYGPMWVCV